MKLSPSFKVLGLFLLGCVALTVYAIAIGPQMGHKASLAADEFFRRSRGYDYEGAHIMLSQRLQGEMNTAAVAGQWQGFIKKHGPLKNWATTSLQRINIFPRHAVFTYTVTGRKGSSGRASLRLVPEGDQWRVDQLIVLP